MTGCLKEGNNLAGCWLGFGGGCLMQRKFIVKKIRYTSDWLFHEGGAIIKAAYSAGWLVG